MLFSSPSVALVYLDQFSWLRSWQCIGKPASAARNPTTSYSQGSKVRGARHLCVRTQGDGSWNEELNLLQYLLRKGGCVQKHSHSRWGEDWHLILMASCRDIPAPHLLLLNDRNTGNGKEEEISLSKCHCHAWTNLDYSGSRLYQTQSYQKEGSVLCHIYTIINDLSHPHLLLNPQPVSG